MRADRGPSPKSPKKEPVLLYLVFRNLRRCFGDYLICFITVSLAAALLFAFNTVTFSPAIWGLFGNATDYRATLYAVTGVVILAVGLLVDFMTRFILQKRGAEFAVCLILGMERGQVSRLFLTEILLVGLISGVTGFLLGILLFQVLAAILLSLFDAEYHFLTDCFDARSLALSAACFALLYLVSVIHSQWTLRREKLASLLRFSRKNEKSRVRSPWVWLGLLFLSLLLCVCFLIGLREELAALYDKNASFGGPGLFFYIPAGIVGIYGIYASGLHLFPLFWDGGPERLLRGTNLFFSRQLSSRLTSDGMLMGAAAVLITLALAAFGIGALYAAAEMNDDSLQDFDIMITLDAPEVDFAPQVAIIEKSCAIRDQALYEVSTTQNADVLRLLDGIAVPYYNYYQDGAMAISLSGYNTLLRQNGIEPLALAPEEYALGVGTDYNERKAIANAGEGPFLEVAGRRLKAAAVGTRGVYRGRQGPWGALLILPDEVYQSAVAAGELVFSRRGLLVTTEEGAPATLSNQLEAHPVFSIENGNGKTYYTVNEGDYVDSAGRLVIRLSGGGELAASFAGGGYLDLQGNPVDAYPSILVRETELENRQAVVSTVGFALFYLGIVFSLTASAILAVQQLSDAVKHRARFLLLRKLGLGERETALLILRQMAVYFLLPLAAPLAMTTLAMALISQAFARYMPFPTLWAGVLAAVLGLFLLVYLCYFLLAYLSFQRNISES